MKLDDSIQFLSLLFNIGEKACFGTHVKEHKFIEYVDSMQASQSLQSMERVSLNPLVSERKDENVTSFRNFMIESDTLSFAEARELMRKYNVPVSCEVFSGNKSLHFYVCLEYDIGSIDLYKYIARWILNILGSKVGLVDGKTINPSRLARLGGGINNTTNKRQDFRTVYGRIPNKGLEQWLLQFLEFQPKLYQNDFKIRSTEPNPHLLKHWVKHCLEEGSYNGKRNSFYHEAAYDFAACGFDANQCVEYIIKNSRNMYEGDFSEDELKNAVYSAYRRLEREGKL